MSDKYSINIPKESYVVALLSAMMVVFIVFYLAWLNRPSNIDLDKDEVNQNQDLNNNLAQTDSRTIFANIKERSPSILSVFNIISPQSQRICGTENPWIFGERIITRDDSLATGGCFSIGIHLINDVTMYLLAHAEDGTLRLLYPNQNCSFLTSNRNSFLVNEMSHYPLGINGERKTFQLADQQGREWIYAVGIYSSGVKEVFERIIEHVPKVCGDQTEFKVKVELFQSILKGLQKSTHKNLQWYPRSFLHQ